MKVRFLCLANSYKRGGHCVAGVLTDGSGWIRPVSPVGKEHALKTGECKCAGGGYPEVFDVVEAHVDRPVGGPHQPESWFIERKPWKRVGRGSGNGMLELLHEQVQVSGLLFGYGVPAIPFGEIERSPLERSLTVVRPDRIVFKVVKKNGGLKSRSVFWLGANRFDLSITDPAWWGRTAGLQAGEYAPEELEIAPDDVLLVISLTEPHAYEEDEEPHCYMLVSTVIVLSDYAVG